MNRRSLCVPELNSAVLRPAHDPLPVVRHSDRQHIVLRQTVRSSPAPSNQTRTLCPVKSIVHALRFPTSFFPFSASRFDGPGELGRPPGPLARRETSQYFSVLSKLPLTNPRASGVNATLYTLSLCPRSLSNSSPVRASQIRTTYYQPLSELLSNKRLSTTHRIEATGSNQSPIRADGDASNSSVNIVRQVGDRKRLRAPVSHVPNPRRPIARPGHNQPPVRREREGVYLLRVTLESVADPLLGDVPNLERQKSCYVEHSARK